MDVSWGLLVWAGIVIVSMLIVVVLALRWGHDPFGFALLAAVLGPIAIIALVGSHQSDKSLPHRFEGAGGTLRARRRVLLAVDGSTSSTPAANAIAGLGLRDVEAIVLTVLPRESQPAAHAAAQQLQEHQREVDRVTGDATRALTAAAVPWRVIVGYGAPGEEIVEAAKAEGAELIVVGRRGAGLTKALLGSVSDRVLKDAGVPVVVID